MLSQLRDITIVADAALREATRRRIFHVALVLSLLFAGLYGLGLHLFYTHNRPETFDPVVAPTLFGLAVFGVHFLGSALVVFLTMSTVRGEAETGLLQTVLVRPIRRSSYIVGRLAAAVVLAGAYVGVTYLSALVLTRVIAGWTPVHPIAPLTLLVCSIVVAAAMGILGSVLLGSAANGIAQMMLFGIGLLGGLLLQIGQGIGSFGVKHLGAAITRAVPQESLYQGALFRLTHDEQGPGGILVRLGPFGGSERPTLALAIWVIAYVLVMVAVASIATDRRDC